MVVTSAAGNIVLQTSTNGDMRVPHDIQCEGLVQANVLRAVTLNQNGTDLDTLLGRREHAFVAASPLVKTYDDGIFGLSLGALPSPFFCAGKINMVGGITVVTSEGRVGFTASRPSGQPTGIVRILFDVPHPRGDGDFLLSCSNLESGLIKAWGTPAPRVFDLHLVVFDQNLNLNNSTIFFFII
jgi:hypothetical protein